MSDTAIAASAAAPAITAAALRRALIAGARRVIAARDELNRINVFPVPDGDTGSNLAAFRTRLAQLKGLKVGTHEVAAAAPTVGAPAAAGK